ncbi:MAG: sugar phosphate isomerase/epimerase family protein [Ilumatobacteraceae bacterium]
MLDRLAAAPISWGICEAPGWGMQLPPTRVLDEMRDLGIVATELGALGWLPTEPAALRSMLADHSLQLIGGFVPLILHRADQADTVVAEARAAAATLAAGGATCFVSAVVSSHEAWERPPVSADEWATVYRNLAIVDEIAAEHGLVQVIHPHVNTLIETADEFQRFLDHTDVKFTLDTGHLFIGGANPVELAERHFDRVGLVHIKDVNMAVAARMRAGELTLMTATQAGLFPAAGAGDVPISATISALESRGYRGWYVLEQDVALTDGEPPLGEGPVLGVRTSIEYLKSLAA